MISADIKPKVIQLLTEFRQAQTPTVTSNTVAKCLHVANATALKALQELLVAGLVEYGRKNPASSQPRFQLTDRAIELEKPVPRHRLASNHRLQGGQLK